MRAHWQPEGYTVPNATVYPYAWLWDSCFHAVIWAALGDADRAVTELVHVFRTQEPDGFVPHVDYERDPDALRSFWGRSGSSTITQPPVHAHAIAALRRAGIAVPDWVVERSMAHVAWFLRARRHPSGLVAIAHPWETGCDDSPRFDHWGAADRPGWRALKGDLVAGVRRSGAGRLGEGFDCAPVSLSAIVAWSARLLGLDDGGLAEAVASRWDADAATWVDAGTAEHDSGRTRTLEGMLGLLVDPRAAALAALDDPAAYASAFGPRGVHPEEPVYDPVRYWRGPVWPQLAYLLVQAGAEELRAPAILGATVSGLAEYWSPEDGAGLGAVPQSWTGLALVLEGHPT